LRTLPFLIGFIILVVVNKNIVSVLKYLSSCHHLLVFFIKGHKLPSSQGSGGHDVCNRVVVTRHHVGIGLLSAADAFHPVSHMAGGHVVNAGVGLIGHFHHVCQGEFGQQIGFHPHRLGVVFP